MDAIEQFKENARHGWANFAANEALTGTAAPKLVRFARLKTGAKVLDVGCGTGVVALTAARAGAIVSGADLTPELIERARENATMARFEIDFKVADVEALPYDDASFDVVLSQFGHMFAPRPDVATREMLRVLKPSGTIAFSTWPPELYMGRLFALLGKYGPALPPGISPPPLWGDPNFIRERLGANVKSLSFERDAMFGMGLSPAHIRTYFEGNFGPASKLIAALNANAPDKLASLRAELESLIDEYFEGNTIRQGFLISRAIKI